MMIAIDRSGFDANMPKPFRSWRRTTTYVLMSAFLVWHTLAMVIPPSPSNYLTIFLTKLLKPYLDIFQLRGRWHFFAYDYTPRDSPGDYFRYAITMSNGEKMYFDPIKDLNPLHPEDWYFRDWYLKIINQPDIFGEYAALHFCNKHMELDPVEITFFALKEDRLSVPNYLSGKRPLDEKLTVTNMLATKPCHH